MKRIACLALACILLSSFPALAANPPKTGATCTKQGVTKNYKGKEFVCKKSGKKLLWSKGVKINVQTETPLSTPSPAPSTTSASPQETLGSIGLNLLSITSTAPFTSRPGSVINDVLKLSSQIRIEQVVGVIQDVNGRILLSASVNVDSRNQNESVWKLTYSLGEILSAGKYSKVLSAQAIDGRTLKFYESPLEIIPFNTTSPTPAPSKSPSSDPLIQTYEKIRKEARSLITERIKESSIQTLNARYLIANTISSQIESIKRRELSVAYTHWKDIFSSNKITIILWDSNSGAWADATYDSVKGNWNAGAKLSVTAKEMSYCNNAFSSNFYNSEDNYVIASCENADFIEESQFKMAHEYTHLVQNSFKMFDGSPKYALWVIEGGAHYYGQIIGFAGDDRAINANINSLLFNYESHGGYKPIRTFIKNSSEKDFADFMGAIEYSSGAAKDTQASYVFGAIATEYLLGKYGETKLLDFWREFRNSQNVAGNFLKVYGFSISNFYGELKGYLNYCLDEAML